MVLDAMRWATLQKALASAGTPLSFPHAVLSKPATANMDRTERDKCTYRDYAGRCVGLTTVGRMPSDQFESAVEAFSTEPIAGVHPLLARWLALECRFAHDDYQGRGGVDDVEVRVRGRRLVLTAPHATNSPRTDRAPFSDAYTGGLAELLGERLDATVGVTIGQSSSNPNRDSEHRLKLVLAPYVGEGDLCVDLHAMRDEHGPDIEIGLGMYDLDTAPRQVIVILRRLEASGFEVVVNERFRAQHEGTMTTWAQRRGAIGLQVEVAWRHLDLRAESHRAVELFEALESGLSMVTGPPQAHWGWGT